MTGTKLGGTGHRLTVGRERMTHMDQDRLVAIDLEEIEREFMFIALNEYGLSAKRGKELLAPVMGVANDDEWYALITRLRDAIKDKAPLSDLDWARSLFLSEVSFGSQLAGAGLDFAPALDAEWLEVLRSIQYKISNAERFDILVSSAKALNRAD